LKFIFADSMDTIDPNYDFLLDEFTPGRQTYWDDKFTHEVFEKLPYDGLLMSRAILGVDSQASRLSQSQAMRFNRVGGREFYRLNSPKFSELMFLGDCGAFSYSKMEKPPYTPAEMVEFYDVGGFSHGCSIDHIIFDFDVEGKGTEESHRRFDITLDLAEKFFQEHKRQKALFEPIAIAQGWSPASLATATDRLIEIGYRYIAIGGLVPLGLNAIRQAVYAVSKSLEKVNDGRIHLLGFAKSEGISELSGQKVVSFDSTSPFLRAFKDSTRNYWSIGTENQIEYFTAIRVPQVNENLTLKNEIKRGNLSQEELLTVESRALEALRDYDKANANIDETLDAVLNYSKFLIAAKESESEKIELKLSKLRQEYRHTLAKMPWKACDCELCRACSIEIMIFRASNRNKRRGMHNVYTFHNYTKQLERA
jgi:hypothetical protein